MASMSNYLEQKVLESVLNGAAFPTLTNIWIGLALTTAFTDAAYTTEISGGGYARVQLTGAFTVADAGGGQWIGGNTSGITFSVATGDWSGPGYTNPVVGWGLFDAATVGNLLIHDVLDTDLYVYSGAVVFFNPDTLQVEAQ